MNNDMVMAKEYREHAAELRGAAAHPHNAAIRAALLASAHDYERLASSLSAIAQINRAVRKRLNATFAGR